MIIPAVGTTSFTLLTVIWSIVNMKCIFQRRFKNMRNVHCRQHHTTNICISLSKAQSYTSLCSWMMEPAPLILVEPWKAPARISPPIPDGARITVSVMRLSFVSGFYRFHIWSTFAGKEHMSMLTRGVFFFLGKIHIGRQVFPRENTTACMNNFFFFFKQKKPFKWNIDEVSHELMRHTEVTCPPAVTSWQPADWVIAFCHLKEVLLNTTSSLQILSNPLENILLHGAPCLVLGWLIEEAFKVEPPSPITTVFPLCFNKWIKSMTRGMTFLLFLPKQRIREVPIKRSLKFSRLQEGELLNRCPSRGRGAKAAGTLGSAWALGISPLLSFVKCTLLEISSWGYWIILHFEVHDSEQAHLKQRNTFTVKTPRLHVTFSSEGGWYLFCSGANPTLIQLRLCIMKMYEMNKMYWKFTFIWFYSNWTKEKEKGPIGPIWHWQAFWDYI